MTSPRRPSTRSRSTTRSATSTIPPPPRHPRGRHLVRRRVGGDHRQPDPRHRLGRDPDGRLLAPRVTVIGNEIARTRVGMYLEHETNESLFARNTIADVATGINVEWRYDGNGSSGNTFEGTRSCDRRRRACSWMSRATATGSPATRSRAGPARRWCCRSLRQSRDREPRVRAARPAARGPAERASRRRPRRAFAPQPHRGQRERRRVSVGSGDTGTLAGNSLRVLSAQVVGNAGYFVSVLLLARALIRRSAAPSRS